MDSIKNGEDSLTKKMICVKMRTQNRGSIIRIETESEGKEMMQKRGSGKSAFWHRRPAFKRVLTLLLAVCMSCTWLFWSFAAVSLGDVDNDGASTAVDARLALRASVGLEFFANGSLAFLRADANGDGTIGADDARTILRASVGLVPFWYEFHENVEVWESYTNKAVLKAYYQQTQRLAAKGGKGTVRYMNQWDECGSLAGLSVVRLFDLDRDGTPELYCAYSDSASAFYSNRQAVYAYAGGTGIKQLYDGEMSNNGSDYSPFVWFGENGSEPLFFGGTGFSLRAYAYRDGALKLVGTRDLDWDNGEMTNTGVMRDFDKVGTTLRIGIYTYDHPGVAYSMVMAQTDAILSLLRGA